MNSWDLKVSQGADRFACSACGAHVLAFHAWTARCRCCGGADLRALPAATLVRERRPAHPGRFQRLAPVG